MGTFVCTYAGQILNEDMANKVRFHVIINFVSEEFVIKRLWCCVAHYWKQSTAKLDFTWLILSLWIYYGVIILKEIWDCCDFFTLRGERVNFRWKLPFYFIIIIIIFFIHQNLYFKLKDSSCSLFYATDVAKQNNIRFKEAALLLSSRRTTSGLDKGKTASGGKSEPKNFVLWQKYARVRLINCTGNRIAIET